jgi:hypothetical protein
MRSGKRPFTDDVVSIAEDGVDLSFAVREEFEYLPKNSVKRFLSLNSSSSAWSLNVNWSLN